MQDHWFFLYAAVILRGVSPRKSASPVEAPEGESVEPEGSDGVPSGPVDVEEPAIFDTEVLPEEPVEYSDETVIVVEVREEPVDYSDWVVCQLCAGVGCDACYHGLVAPS